jgi:hypothetical protein
MAPEEEEYIAEEAEFAAPEAEGPPKSDVYTLLLIFAFILVLVGIFLMAKELKEFYGFFGG